MGNTRIQYSDLMEYNGPRYSLNKQAAPNNRIPIERVVIALISLNFAVFGENFKL